jgi:transcription elongation factor GreA
MDDTLMTAEELAALHAELRTLETTGRSEMAGRIKTAREWGDLKENAEYHAAKEEQAHLETKIARTRERIRTAVVVEAAVSSETVQYGSTVSFTDRKSSREQTLRIISGHEAKPAQGTLSISSPVAKALIGHRVGDVVHVQTPSGARELVIDGIA